MDLNGIFNGFSIDCLMDCLVDLNGLFNGFERDFKGVLVGFNKGI